MSQEILGKQIGNYRVTHELASGTFGSVYLAKHLVFDDEPEVAIKLLHAHLRSSEEQERFLQEARFLRKLKHPYILPLIDAGLYENFFFLIVEYASNGSLRDRLHTPSSQRISVTEALVIISQIGQALQYAHDRNIVHRDLKPANILFNAQGDALLADFGIAVLLEKTQRIEAEGTPPYMAPEQFVGKISKKSDQYSLACIAYELLTGRKPFIALDVAAMGYMHINQPPTPPTQFNSDLPDYIEQAILKAMEKRHTDRYASIADFISALQKSPQHWLDQGNTLFAQKQYEEALAAYNQTLLLNPDFAPAHYNKGKVLYEMMRYKDALSAYEQALLLDPDSVQAYISKGDTLYSLKHYKEALTSYEQAIRLDPHSAQAYTNKGRTSRSLKHYKEALTAYEQALRLDPTSIETYDSALFDSLRQTQPFIETHWAIRMALLKIATTISTLESGTSADFLLDVPLADFGRLLESLPSTEWKYKAALVFLAKVTNGRRKTHGPIGQEQEVVLSLETNFDQIKNLIQLLLVSPLGQHTQPQWAGLRTTALDLLWLFTNSADQYKNTLLTLWLDDVRMRNILPDRPLDSLRLNRLQEEVVLKEYGPTFMQLSGGGNVVAPLFWRMAANRSSQKMELLSTFLEKKISLENFAALLDPHYFSSAYRFNAEEIHVLLMGCSTDYANEYAKISNPTHSPYQRPKSLPQYLRLYPQVPLWTEAITILGQAKHKGKMPLIHAWTTVAIDEQKQRIPKIQEEQITELLDGAVASDEYYTILRQHGPAMLRIPSLAPHVPSYYMTLHADTTLLYTLLDTYLTPPIDYNIAEQLMETTSFASNNSAREFVHRYAKKIPQLCYHLTWGRDLCKQLGWQEVQVYIYDWLRDGIEQQELEDIFADVPLEKVDSSLIENCGEIALEKFPQSRMLLTLTRYYLHEFGPDRLKSAKGARFIDFLFKYKQKNYFPEHFAGLGELIQDFHSIRQFILESTQQLQQLQEIFRLINTKDPKFPWIDLVANELVAHLNYSGDLGFIISSLSILDRESPSLCLISMAECVKDDTKKANSSRWQQATILLESALLPDLLDYISEGVNPEEVKNEIISNLLKDSSPEFCSYINQQSQFWLPETQQQWHAVAKRYGFTLTSIKRPSSLHPAPVQKTTAASPVEPAAPSTTVSTVAVPQTRPVPPALQFVRDPDPEEVSSGLRGWLRAWLIFPWLFLRLGLLCRETGNGSLVLFWSNHRKALIQSRRLTPHQWKQRLKFAYDFYYISQKETATADQELWPIIENNTQFLKKLDYHEIERIHLAANSLKKPVPSEVPSLSKVSKK